MSMKIIDKINAFLIERQLKHSFRPKHKYLRGKLYCCVCDKQINKRDGYGFDCDGNGNVSNIICKSCERKKDTIQEQIRQETCKIPNHSIGYCFQYCENSHICFQEISKDKIDEYNRKENKQCKQ